MIGAAFSVMARRLLRDPGALAMALLLPGVMYVVFAGIFSYATSGETVTKIAYGAAPGVDDGRFVSALEAHPAFDVVDAGVQSRADVEARVAGGAVDAGLFLRSDPGAFSEGAPFVVIGAAARPLAAINVAARIEGVFAEAMPDKLASRRMGEAALMVGDYTPAQRARAEQARAAILAGEGVEGDFRLTEIADIPSRIAAGDEAVAESTYYAGAIAVMFVLFATAQGALIMHEEREAGVTARRLLGARDVAGLVFGRFAFLTLIGVLQTAVIFALAVIFFGAPVAAAITPVAVVTIFMAAACAGVGLAIVSCFATAQQAHAASSFLVLTISAVGGSMAPRYLMPEWLRQIGQATPNSWAIDAYVRAIVNGEGVGALAAHLGALGAFALFGFALATAFAYRERARYA